MLLSDCTAVVATPDCWLAYSDPRLPALLLEFAQDNNINSVKVQKPLLREPSAERSLSRGRARAPRRIAPRRISPRRISPRLPSLQGGPRAVKSNVHYACADQPSPPSDSPGVRELMDFITKRLQGEGESNVEYMKVLDNASSRQLKPQWNSNAEYHASVVERRHDGLHLAGISLAILGEHKDDPEFGQQLDRLEKGRKGIAHFASISAELVKSGLEIIVLITADRPSIYGDLGIASVNPSLIEKLSGLIGDLARNPTLARLQKYGKELREWVPEITMGLRSGGSGSASGDEPARSCATDPPSIVRLINPAPDEPSAAAAAGRITDPEPDGLTAPENVEMSDISFYPGGNGSMFPDLMGESCQTAKSYDYFLQENIES